MKREINRGRQRSVGTQSVLWALLVAAALLRSCLSALGAETDLMEEPRPPASSHEIRFAAPFSYSEFLPQPAGYEAKHFAPPYEIRYRYQPIPPKDEFRAWLEARLGFPPFSGPPAIGISVGPRYRVAESLLLRLSLDLDTQLGYSSKPIKESYLENWRWGGTLGGSYELGIIAPFLEVSWIEQPATTIGTFENLTTKVDWDHTLLARAGARFSAGLLLGDASLSIIRLPQVAFASHEFAFAIPSSLSQSLEIGAGIRLGGDVELWIRAARTSAPKGDPIEYFYQVPAYMNDYLMSQNTWKGELRWRF